MLRTIARATVMVAASALSGCAGGECFVGVRGTAASVTVKGAFPAATCKAVIETPARFFGDLADGSKDLYEMTEKPAQPVVCEHTIDGKRFVVRDDGMLKVIGNAMCAGLSKRADR